MAKQNVSNLKVLNLVDEEGTNHKCMVPHEDYNVIMGGDYDLANTYLQKEIERKNRMLAFQLLKREQSKYIVVEQLNTCDEGSTITSCASNNNNVVESIVDNLSQCNEDNLDEIYEDNMECFEPVTPSTTNELWPYNAVIELISSMAIHYGDLSHPKKKKYVFSNISNELLSKQLIYSEKACYNKWRSLLRSYKATKDKKMSTGQGATRFMFYNAMDEILGNKPSHSSGHTIQSNDTGSEENNTPIPDLMQDEASTEDSSSGIEAKRKKRVRKSVNINQAAKQRRHEERMEMEDRKLSIEERKLALIEKFLEKV